MAPWSPVALPPRFVAARRTRLVGRRYELGVLETVWDRVRHGAGQVLLVGGEPGAATFTGRRMSGQEMTVPLADGPKIARNTSGLSNIRGTCPGAERSSDGRAGTPAASARTSRSLSVRCSTYSAPTDLPYMYLR